MRKMSLACAVLLVSPSAHALDCGDKDVVDGVIAVAKKNNVFLMEAVADFVHQKMAAQEGFDTRDLKEAKALLKSLAA